MWVEHALKSAHPQSYHSHICSHSLSRTVNWDLENRTGHAGSHDVCTLGRYAKRVSVYIRDPLINQNLVCYNVLCSEELSK